MLLLDALFASLIAISGEGIFCVAVFLLMGWGAFTLAWIVVQQHLATGNTIAAAYEAVAQKYGGQFELGGMLGQRRVTFPWNNVQATLGWSIEATEAERERPFIAILQIPWPHRDECLQVGTWGFLKRPDEFPNVEEVKTLDAKFDARFESRLVDPKHIGEVLNPRSREILFRLANLAASTALVWTIENRLMTVAKNAVLDSPAMLEFVALALDLHHSTLTGGRSGKEIGI